jgi:predicted transcriptional regulator
MLKFQDDTQIRVNGLNEILAELYSEGRQANRGTAEEIINRLEAQKNFIPSSDRTRKEYAYVLLKEYRQYVAGRKNNTP